MFSNFLKINLFLILFSSFSFAEVVKQIDIKGNLRVSDEAIKVLGNFKVGNDLNNNSLNTILKDLYSTDFFKDIKISLKNNSLEIQILENPIIQSIFINGIKKKNIKKKLFDILTVKEKNSYVPYKIDIDRKRVLNTLKTAGFYFANIDTKLVTNNNNTVDIIYDIDVGDKANIKKIKFTGSKKFKDRKLKNVITSEENKMWKIISNKKYLDEQRINLDKRLLNNFYKNKGYYDVQINSFTAEFLDSGNFELNFNINAGEKFFFNEFTLELPDDFEKIYFDNIVKLFNKLKNEPYSLSRIEDILEEIDKIALSKQYEFISADVEEIIVDNNKLNFNIFLKETEKFYVDRINIFGNTVTRESVIRNEFFVDEGDAYNEILHTKTINRLKAKRIFKSVKSEVVNSEFEDKKILNITVEEKPTGEISAGAGIGTSGGSVGFSVKENNYLGKGIKLNSTLNIEADAIKGGVQITIPNYRYSDNSLIASAQSSSEDNLTKRGFKTGKTGFTLGTSFEQYENFYFTPAFSVYHETLETDSKASKNLKKQEGSYSDIFFDHMISLDTRDQGYQPTSGFKSSFSQTLPVYSQNYAITNGYTFSSYHNLAEEMTGVFSIYTKMITSLSDEDVRISNRLHIPSNRLRGFEKGKIGPKDSSGYVGGNYITTLNLSTNLPQVLPSLQNLDFVFFMDAANIWGVDYTNSIDDSSVIRSSAGVGVDWFTPIGPLNFSLSKAITSKKTDKTETFRFNLGTTF
jgi:outer membrane protein insertion porin family